MYTLKHVALSQFNEPNQDLQDLHEIFRKTLNTTLSYKEFRHYYFEYQPHLIDITFIQCKNEIIGFICAAFYKHNIGNEKYTICRGATGIEENHRGGNLPSWQLCRKYIIYKIRHPWEKMYITAYMANPLMYSMICKYTDKVYPKIGISVPHSIHKLRDNILEFYEFKKKVIAPFILKIHFQVQLNEKDLERIYSSNDKNIHHYLELNKHFQNQVGLLTIVPVSWNNISVSTIRALKKMIKKFIRSIG